SNGRFTGRPKYPLCYGEGKIARATELARAAGFDLGEATFYSDSATDLPLLYRVREPIAVNPDMKLRHVGALGGWPVERGQKRRRRPFSLPSPQASSMPSSIGPLPKIWVRATLPPTPPSSRT